MIYYEIIASFNDTVTTDEVQGRNVRQYESLGTRRQAAVVYMKLFFIGVRTGKGTGKPI